MFPVLFKCGPITIYSYGVMVSLAFAIGVYLMRGRADAFGVAKEKIIDFMMVILISGIIGARILHVIVNLGYYRFNPIEIFMITKGGLAFYGGLIASTIAGIVFIKVNRMPVWNTGDLTAPYIALGQAIGRIGCFLNGCCYGVACKETIFAVKFPGDTVYRVPTQLIASIVLLFMYGILRYFAEKKIFKGNLFFVYLAMYSVQRFSVEFLRGDLDRGFLNLTVSQHISAIVLIIASAIFFIRMKHGKV